MAFQIMELEGQISISQDSFPIILWTFPFSETQSDSVFAGYRRLMKHIKLMMAQQRMRRRITLLPIPSVLRNSNKQTALGRAER